MLAVAAKAPACSFDAFAIAACACAAAADAAAAFRGDKGISGSRRLFNPTSQTTPRYNMIREVTKIHRTSMEFQNKHGMVDGQAHMTMRV